jgi:hypothetical protein
MTENAGRKKAVNFMKVLALRQHERVTELIHFFDINANDRTLFNQKLLSSE